MKIMHLSDLHLGKHVNKFSMIEDQRYILDRIVDVADQEKPDAVIIAGDVYDVPQPPVEAMELLDDFLDNLSKRNLHVFEISGNHDSAARIAFGNKRLVEKMHISPVYSGNVECIRLNDEYGPVDFFMLPFVKPVIVRSIYPDEKIEDYTDAVKAAVSHMKIDSSHRNVLIAHQFVTGAERCDSEELSIGGLDNVDVSVFEPFDYVALGHIHKGQKVFRETVRYSGTPLKYSFSEINHKKSVTVVEFGSGKNPSIRTVPLKPLRDMREIKGSYDDVVNLQKSDDYLHIVLTDENEVPDAISELRKIFPNVMKLDYDNSRTRYMTDETDGVENAVKIHPFDLFTRFFRERTNSEMNEDQKKFVRQVVAEIWEKEE